MMKSMSLLVFALFVAALLPFSDVCHALLPDTGQTGDYTATFGEDSDYTINPHSYTKLDPAGNDLPDSAPSWAMVRDNVTGLIWEVKNARDGISDPGNPHDADNGYAWQDARDVFVASLNAVAFGGFTDWRMPGVHELSYIVDKGRFCPSISSAYFPNTYNNEYWTGTPAAGLPFYYYYIDFCHGFTDLDNQTREYHARAVRGGTPAPPVRFTDNADGTVTDLHTGLMWQQDGLTELDWEGALSFCEGLVLAEHSDWRLPSANELQSIADYTTFGPAIDTAFFPDTATEPYWSSSTYINFSTASWYVHFDDGVAKHTNKTFACGRFVRAVRGQVPTAVGLASLEAVPENGAVFIEWETDSETDNAGFNIYRSANGDKQEKINGPLVPAEGSPTEGAAYIFEDTGVRNGKTYRYLLEAVDLRGAAVLYGPVSATPRLIYGIPGL